MGEGDSKPPRARGVSYAGSSPSEKRVDKFLSLAQSFFRDLCAELEGSGEPLLKETAAKLQSEAANAAYKTSLSPVGSEAELKLRLLEKFVHRYAKGFMHQKYVLNLWMHLEGCKRQMRSAESSGEGVAGINMLWDSFRQFLWDSSSLNSRSNASLRKRNWERNIARAALRRQGSLAIREKQPTTAAPERKNGKTATPIKFPVAVKEISPNAPTQQPIAAVRQSAQATEHVPDIAPINSLLVPKPEGNGRVSLPAMPPMAEPIRSMAEPIPANSRPDEPHGTPKAGPQNMHESSKPPLPPLAQNNGVFGDGEVERLREAILSAALYDEATFSFFGPPARAAEEALEFYFKSKPGGNPLSFDAVAYHCKPVPYNEGDFHEAVKRVERGIKAVEFHFLGLLGDGSLTRHSSEAAALFHANPKQVEGIITEVIQVAPDLWNKRADAGQMERRAREAPKEMKEAALEKPAATAFPNNANRRLGRGRAAHVKLQRTIPRPSTSPQRPIVH